MFDEDENDNFSVDLTPLIDVIFMLVIFFIMTASFDLPVLDLQLPTAQSSGSVADNHRVSVVVDKDGNLKISGQSVTFDEIASRLSESDKSVLEVVIDSRAPSGILVRMADIARVNANGRLLIVAPRDNQNGKQAVGK